MYEVYAFMAYFHSGLTDSIQKFTLDNKGGGKWTEVLGFVGEKPFPTEIDRTSSRMFTNDEKNAYSTGGFMADTTSPTRVGTQINSGLLILNFETVTLTNSSSLGLAFLGSVLLNVPIYGSQGVLLAFGGSNDDGAAGLNVINVFDKKEQKWYQQIAEGAEGVIPRPRNLFCAVGVHGKEHTSFEM